MLRATIIRIDGSILIQGAEIQAQAAKRGTGDGHIWRGFFRLAGMKFRPTMGETLHLRLGDSSQIAAVVTEVVDNCVYFRARGKKPVEQIPQSSSEAGGRRADAAMPSSR